MPNREQASEIEDVATAWAAKAGRGLTTSERAELETWLEGDSRRLGAFVRAQAAWIHAERAAALGAMPEPSERDAAQHTVDYAILAPEKPKGVSRRLLLGGGGALAASVAAAAYFGADRYRSIESGLGEVRHIALTGGTSLTLDTDSRVDIALSSKDTRLTLVRGRLFLDIAQRQGALFKIDVSNLVLATADAAFSLQSIASNPIVALVTKGSLMVSQSQGLLASSRTVAVGPGQALTLASDERIRSSDVRPVAAAQRDQLLAWRDGMLSFGGEVLADAVRAFDRYNAVRIVVSDPALAGQRVTGLFKANDPRGFASAIAASFGGVVQGDANTIRISAQKPTA